MKRTKIDGSTTQFQWSALPSPQTAVVSVTVSLLCLLLASPGARADGPASQEGFGLEEIVVTAEKRESTVQTTPISLTAVSGVDIQERGLTDLSDLLLSIPGVSVRTSGAGLAEFELRGIASTGGNSPTVGFYYGDTPLTAPSGSNEGKTVISPALYDLNRVEVLRGPQGTLYGSGSMGGTIKLVPNAPNPEGFGTSAEAVLGGTEHGGFNHAENAMVNLPFGAGLAAVRIVGSYSEDSGWIDRVVAAPGTFPVPTDNNTVRGNVLAAPVSADYKGVNEVDRTTAHISALLKLVDGLTITPSFFYEKMTSGGLPYIDSNPGTNAHYQPFDIAEPYSDEFKLSSLNLEYRTDLFDLDSTSSYWTRHDPVVQDASESWQTGFPLPSFYPAYGGIGPSPAIEDNQSHQTSEEVRLASVGDSSLKWLVGYFYEDFESEWNVYYPAPEATPVLGSTNIFTYLSPNKILQQSVFGEATYNITQALAATAGLRRYSYDESVVVEQSGAIASPAGTTTSAERNQGVLPKFSLFYDVNPDLLLYTTAAKGFRPGGGTGPVPTSGLISCETELQSEYGTNQFVPGPNSFKPDRVWSYEIGEKLRAADRRVTINSAVYFESWTGVQQTNSLSPCGFIYVANAGNAHVYGGELEIQAVLARDLVLSANTGYVHAALVSSNLISPSFTPGTAIQDDPRWTASGSLVYRHALNDQLAFIARADTTYTGTRTDETFVTNTLPPYDLTNVRAGVEGENWSAVLFVNNVADKRALLNDITQAAVNLATYNRIAVSQPLTAGIDLNYRFGSRH
jgi:outer membrane receptor protein involved in Fe transport